MDKRPNVDFEIDPMEMYKENLAHARHIENERMTFLSLFLVGLATIIDFTPSSKPWLSLCLGVVLLGLAVIATLLLARWSQVYDEHMQIAKKLMRQMNPGGRINDYYLLDNKALQTQLKPGYTRTTKYFSYFNALIYLIIIVYIADSIIKII